MSVYPFLKKLLFQLDPEQAHTLIISAGKANQVLGLLPLVRPFFAFESPLLKNNLLGLSFANPVGLAAGFDKNGQIVEFLGALGFGFVEIGSVSRYPRPGNPRPRIFRLPEDSALINRMGLNNKGADEVASVLKGTKPISRLGINLVGSCPSDVKEGMAASDIVDCYQVLAPYADYVVLNVSCPNTSDGKTFEEPSGLRELLDLLNSVRKGVAVKPPLLVKFSADLSEADLEASVAAAEAEGVQGYVLTNTTIRRDGLKTAAERIAAIGNGGLSGLPIQERTVAKVRQVFRQTCGVKPIIGLGGIDSADSAYRLIKAGASLVQVYTGMIYQGPALCKTINRGLVRLLERDGIESITQAIGVEA